MIARAKRALSEGCQTGICLDRGLGALKLGAKEGQSSFFEQERQRRLRIPVDCRIRQELRTDVPLQRLRRY